MMLENQRLNNKRKELVKEISILNKQKETQKQEHEVLEVMLNDLEENIKKKIQMTP